MRKILERIEANGEWWIDPWWEKPLWVGQTTWTVDEVRKTTHQLQTYFPASWALSLRPEPWHHFFVLWLVGGEGVFQLRSLMQLASALRSLEGSPGFITLLNNLREIQRSNAACMELTLANIFTEQGYGVEFPSPRSKKGKTPDIVVKLDDEVVAIECKQLAVSKKEQWFENVNSQASQKVIDLLKDDELCINFSFTYNPLSNPFFDLKTLPDPVEVINRLAEKIRAAICLSFNKESLPYYFHSPAIGNGVIYKKRGKEDICTIRHQELPDELLSKRLFSNGIRRAAEQLAAQDIPGIAVIHLKNHPDIEATRANLFDDIKETPRLYRNISGILLYPWANILSYQQPTLICNPSANTPLQNLGVFDVLRKQLNPVVC